MNEIRCSLLTDGTSDDALVPVLRWLLRQHSRCSIVEVEWADLSRLRRRPRNLSERISAAIDYFPCAVLFVHRDSEAQAPDRRYEEIDTAVAAARKAGRAVPQHVCVVPVRKQEAWLLLDEGAIRNAAGNPNGRMPLDLPKAERIESIPDPKDELYGRLKTASGMKGRRLKRLAPSRLARLVTEHMNGFACLRALPAFQRLEQDIRGIAAALH